MRLLLTLFRTVLTGIVGIVATIIGAFLAIVIALIKDTSPMIDRVIRGWSRAWLWASGTRVTVQGAEHVDRERSYVVVANHLSALDIMACFIAIRLPIRYLAKKELFKIPVLAQGMRAVGIIEVDRQARSAVHHEVNRQARELIEKKRSLIIFAEGTRPRDGSMKPFKKGAFTMAVGGGLPVLPVSIHGTREAFPPGQMMVRGGPVTVIIDPAIETEGMTAADTTPLRNQTYDIISGRVREMGGPVG